MQAIPSQAFKVAEHKARGIEAFAARLGIDELCDCRLAAVRTDDDIRADGHARAARISQRGADDAVARCGELQLRKSDAVANLRASLAGRIDQQGIEHRAPRRKTGIDAMTRLYVDSDRLVAVVERRRSDGGRSRCDDVGNQAPAIELDDRAPHQRVRRQRVRAVGLPVDDQDLGAGPRQEQGRGSAGTACTDDDHVVAFIETMERVHRRCLSGSQRGRGPGSGERRDPRHHRPLRR